MKETSGLDCNAKVAVKSTSRNGRLCRLCVRPNHSGLETIFGVKANPFKFTPRPDTVKSLLLLALVSRKSEGGNIEESFFEYLLRFVLEHRL